MKDSDRISRGSTTSLDSRSYYPGQGAFAHFFGAFQRKLYLYSDISQREWHGSQTPLQPAAGCDDFQHGSIPRATLQRATERASGLHLRKPGPTPPPSARPSPEPHAAVHAHSPHHPEVSHRELFFDLVYVVVCIELGIFLHHHITWGQLGYTFLLFTSFWLDWFHTNAINSCIEVRNPWLAMLMSVTVGALGLAAHAVSIGGTKLTEVSDTSVPFTDHRVACAIFLLLPRVAFAAIYANIWYYTSKYDTFAHTRRLRAGLFTLGFLFSIALCVVMSLVEDHAAVRGLWITLVAVEISLYLVTAIIIKPAMQWKVAPAFAKERDTVWVFLVLGESIISLGLYGDIKNVNFYLQFFIGLALIYAIMRLFVLSQPAKLDIVRHALYGAPLLAFLRNMCLLLMSFGILCIGVGLKSVMLAEEERFERPDAFVLTGGLACTLFFLHLCRFTHISIVRRHDPLVYGLAYNVTHGLLRRYAVWAAQAIFSLAFIPLGLAGLTAHELLAVLLAGLVVLIVVDIASQPDALELELLRRMHTPVRLADLMAGYDPAREPAAAAPVPWRAMSAAERARARKHWKILRGGVLACLYAEKNLAVLEHYSSPALTRPGAAHHTQWSLEKVLAHVMANIRARHASLKDGSGSPTLDTSSALSMGLQPAPQPPRSRTRSMVESEI